MSPSSLVCIEFNGDRAIIAECSTQSNRLSVLQLYDVVLPPACVTDTHFLDIDLIAETLTDSFEVQGVQADSVLMCLNSRQFFKRSEKFLSHSAKELYSQVEDRVSQQHFFQERLFSLATSVYGDTSYTDEHLQSNSVSYAAISYELQQDFYDLAGLLNKELLSISNVPLAVLRTQLFVSSLEVEGLFCFVDTHSIDFNIVKQGKLLGSYSLRQNLQELLSSDEHLDCLLQRLRQFLFSFTNMYPTLELPNQFIYSSRLGAVQPFFERVSQELSLALLPIQELDTVFHSTSDAIKESLRYNGPKALPVLGMALSAFNQPAICELPKLLEAEKSTKKVHNPFVKRWVLRYAAALLCLGLIHAFVMVKLTAIDDAIATAKAKITVMQSSDFIDNQMKFLSMQRSIHTMSSGEDVSQSLRALFFTITQQLPDDMSLTYVELLNKQDGDYILLKGEAYFHESIYAFYQALDQHYLHLDLKQISGANRGQSPEPRKFYLSFLWRAK